MARPNPISSIMAQPLPSITYQRSKLYRPGIAEVVYSYNIVNRYIFDNQLRRPDIYVQSHLHKVWGYCCWLDQEQYTGSHCIIKLSDKWFCQQWFLNTIAHEMVHQYQWDVERFDRKGFNIREDSGAHGPSFYAWRDRFSYYGLNLKTSFGQRRWFRHQDFNKA